MSYLEKAKPSAKAKNLSENGSALQIINVNVNNGGQSTMTLNVLILKQILEQAGDREVAVISIVGPSRTGKSFMLSFMILYLQHLATENRGDWIGSKDSMSKLSGFPYRNGYEIETAGIHLWSHPFFLKKRDGSKVAIFLMDTQGVYDRYTSEREWSGIIGLALSTCSCLIYNVKSIEENMLQSLASFLQFAQHMSHLDSNTKSNNIIFQRLAFLIRDWSNPEEYSYGPLGGQQYADTIFKKTQGMHPQSIEMRKIIRESFEHLNCFLLPAPGEKALALDFTGSNSELAPAFINNVKLCVEAISSEDNLDPKTMTGSKIRGRDLVSIMQNYVKAYNSNSGLMTMNTWSDTVAHTTCSIAKEKAIETFNKYLKDNWMEDKVYSKEKIDNMKLKAKQLAEKVYSDEKKLGSEAIAKKYKKELNYDMDDEFKKFSKTRKDNIEQLTLLFMNQAVAAFTTFIQTNMQDLASISDNDLKQYLKQARQLAETELSKLLEELPELLSSMLSKLDGELCTIEKEIRSKRNDLITKLTQILNESISPCVHEYKDTMKKLLETQTSIITDEQLRRYDEISRKQAGSVASIPNSLSKVDRIQMFEENLKTELNKAFAEIVEENSKLWDENNKQIIQRIEQLTGAVVHSFNNKIANNSIVTMEQLENLFADETVKVNQKFQTLDIIKSITLGELQRYNLNLKSHMDAALKNVGEYLGRHRAQMKQNINEFNSKAVTTYTSSFKQRLNTDGVMTDEQIQECHIKLRKDAFSLQMPGMTPEEKEKFYRDLETQLMGIFETMKLKNDFKCKEAWKHIEQWCIKMTTSHQEALLKFGNQRLFNENELRKYHDSLIQRAQNETLQEIAKFGKYLQRDLMEKVHNSLNQSIEEVIINYRKEQDDQNDILVSIRDKALAHYDVKMNESCSNRLNQGEVAFKNCHKLHRITALEVFDNDVKKKNIKSPDLADFKNNLSREIEAHFDICLRNMEMASQNIKDMKEVRYERYQASISDFLKSFPTQIELNARHEKLKREQLHAFEDSMMEAERGTVNIRQLRLSLSKQIQTYYETHIETQFTSLVREHNENVKRVIRNVEEFYSNEMNKMLSGCMVEEENKLRDYHSSAYTTAIKEYQNLTATWEERESRSTEQEVVEKINKKFKDLIFKQDEILNELKETASHEVDMSVQEYEDKILGYASTHNVENFGIKAESLMKSHMIQFRNKTTLPWKSLIDEFVDKLDKRLRAKFEIRNKILRDSFQDMKIVQLEIRDVIADYKKEIKKLIDGKIVEENELLNYHLQAVETAKVILLSKGVEVNTSVEESLKEAVKPAFKKFSDENNKNASITSGSPAVGIDLGTTFSCIALYTHNGVEVISNNNGEKTTPSYVMFGTNGQVVHVGTSAKELAHEDPTNTIFDVKRLIGKKIDDPNVQSDMKLWPFQVISEDGVPKIKLDSKETENYTVLPPEQISAAVLGYLKKSAEEYLNKEVKRAVITVPAKFNDGQRQATRDAGEIAGFEVLAIINEPTAAAIAYSLQYDDDDNDDKNVLVYDFGGGTFDVSVLKMKGGKIDVLSTDGDTHLGGQDIDNALMSYCVEEFRKQTKFDALEVNENESIGDTNKRNRRLRRLRNQCEKNKCYLSAGCPSVTISVDVFTERDLRVEVTKEKFEEICNNIFERTMSIVSKAVEAAGLTKSNIDDVVLVGGSTKIPKVQQMLKDEFPNKGLKRNVNPDEAVAFGAAIHAAILNNQWDKSSKQINLSDVTPASIGIEVRDGSFSVIVKKNTTIPTIKTEEYFTTIDNQDRVSITVFEGEDKIAQKNHKLGEFKLGGIPPGKAGSQTIIVTIEIDLDGILHVRAVCGSTGESSNLTIQASKGRLTKEEIRRCRELASC